MPVGESWGHCPGKIVCYFFSFIFIWEGRKEDLSWSKQNGRKHTHAAWRLKIWTHGGPLPSLLTTLESKRISKGRGRVLLGPDRISGILKR